LYVIQGSHAGEEFDEIEFENPVKLTDEEHALNDLIEKESEIYSAIPEEARVTRVLSKSASEAIKKLLKIIQGV
jgi:hypothetical protein